MFKRYLEKLSCKHKWQQLDETKTIKLHDSVALVVHAKKVLTCKECGAIKIIEL